MRTTNTFGIVFYLKKCKAKDGKAPIYVRITVDGNRTDISLKKNIEMKYWNGNKGMAKGNTDDIRHLNTHLEKLRAQLVGYYQDLQLKRKLITSDSIKNLFLGIGEQEYTLMNLIEYHNTEMKNVLEWGTLKNYSSTKKYLQLYLSSKLRTSDVYLTQLDYKFLIGFEKFIKDHQPLDHHKACGQNTVMKHIERLRKMINLAIRNEWLERDPFQKFKSSFIRSTRQYLTQEELISIESKEFSIQRLKQVKDLFVFSCYTGLAYIDVFNLTPQNISIGIDGEYWINTSRKKTDQLVKVPLLPKAMAIIEKYKTDPAVINKGKLLPSLSNQRLNSYLKEIADLCSITKPLTFHIARHTFATTVTLTNGVPIETVSSMLGHTSIRTTQIYAKVIQQKVSQDMKALRLKMQQTNTEFKINKAK